MPRALHAVQVQGPDTPGNVIEVSWDTASAAVAQGAPATINYPVNATGNEIYSNMIPRVYNRTTLDMLENNVELTVLASAARVAGVNSADFVNFNARGLLLLVNVTVNPGGAETLGLQVQMKDPVSAAYQDLTLFTASTFATNPMLWCVYPGAVETAALTWFELQAVPLPRTWRVRTQHSAAGSWTYSIGASYIW